MLIKKINKKILTLSIILYFSINIKAQDVYSNLFYSCQDCKISKIESFGENKVLLYHDGGIKKDYIFLLDSNNLFIDTLRTASSDGKIIKLSDSEFIAQDLNVPIQVKIVNNKFVESTKIIFPTYTFKEAYNGADFILDGKYMFGRINKIFIDNKFVYDVGFCCTDISNAKLKEISKYKKITYGFIVDKPYFMLDYKKRYNVNLPTDTIIDYKLTLKIRSNCTDIGQTQLEKDNGYNFGFYSYAFSDSSIFYFNMRNQTLYFINRGSFKLEKYFELPIAYPNKNAWKHYYDNDDKRHYFLKMVKTEKQEDSKKKQKEKGYEFMFELFEYRNNALIYRCTIDYIPKLITKDCLYRIIEKENSTDILKIPISNIITKKETELNVIKVVDVE